MKLTTTVTKEVLKATANCAPPTAKSCAITYAVRDFWPAAFVLNDRIIPFPTTASVADSAWIDKAIELPQKAKLFVIDFDSFNRDERLAMPEISFDIEVPDWALELIDISELKPLLEGHPTLKLETV